ncbi:MAG: amidohydrolase family protein [Solitalea-like symbiont of Tyrophagus putrescentiae]
MKKYSAKKIYTLDTAPIDNGVVIVDQNNTITDILDSSIGLEDVEHFDGYICPGFINTHCHLELSHLANKITQGAGLTEFIKEVQLKRNIYSKDEITKAIADAEQTMINNGIVAVGDITNSDVSFNQKNKKNLKYHSFIEVFGLQKTTDTIIKESNELLNKAPQTSSITPHAPYSVSEELFKTINTISDSGTLISVHNQESEEENKLYQHRQGKFLNLYEHFKIDLTNFNTYNKTSVKTYLQWLKNGKKLLVHNTYTNKDDLDFIKKQNNIYICLCPGANLYIEKKLADIKMLHKSNIPITIGTDSLASNNNLCILSEILIILKQYPEITLQEVLSWACKNAAEYFGYTQLGTLTIGKSPGLLSIDIEKKEVFLITKANF